MQRSKKKVQRSFQSVTAQQSNKSSAAMKAKQRSKKKVQRCNFIKTFAKGLHNN
ncbi:hypothetical protein [Polaribacter sp.]|uniref:hypothetical protein n=1 Tax=Polaribacter sp. TaxID=1920175 RepID=UPI0040481A5F